MRVSGLFGGLLMLFMLIRGSEDVSVTCGQRWLQSRLKPRPSLTQKAQHHEICLGTGCPATGGTSDFFEFLYPLSSRGTRVEQLSVDNKALLTVVTMFRVGASETIHLDPDRLCRLHPRINASPAFPLPSPCSHHSVLCIQERGRLALLDSTFNAKYLKFTPRVTRSIVQERPWGILIESSITYVPTNLNITSYLPISWYTQRAAIDL
ncbi:oocyte-secreted protein 4A [Canis aureus]